MAETLCGIWLRCFWSQYRIKIECHPIYVALCWCGRDYPWAPFRRYLHITLLL